MSIRHRYGIYPFGFLVAVSLAGCAGAAPDRLQETAGVRSQSSGKPSDIRVPDGRNPELEAAARKGSREAISRLRSLYHDEEPVKAFFWAYVQFLLDVQAGSTEWAPPEDGPEFQFYRFKAVFNSPEPVEALKIIQDVENKALKEFNLIKRSQSGVP